MARRRTMYLPPGLPGRKAAPTEGRARLGRGTYLDCGAGKARVPDGRLGTFDSRLLQNPRAAAIVLLNR